MASIAQRRRARRAGNATARFSYVLPVHNQERVIEHTVLRLLNRLQTVPGSEVLLIENGSGDRSAQICATLAAAHATAKVPVRIAQSAPGLGYALRRGIDLACGDVLVLSAADLPFGFTDLDAFLAQTPRPKLAIGSKAHPGSHVRVPLQRRLMSEGFRLLRRVTLGLATRDSQGTILIEAQLARTIAPELRCGDFLISTEIVAWAECLGIAAVELPITYTASGSTTVSPLRDSVRMAAGMLALRRRLRTAAARRLPEPGGEIRAA
jgi:hypothetical protein